MNTVENFLASFKFAHSTKDSYRRILNQLITIPDLDQLDAAGLINFITRPGWGNSQQNVAIFCSQKFLKWLYNDHHPALAATIPHWFNFRKPADGVGNLFVSLKTGKALTGNGMASFFKRLSKAIGFKISPHDLRSSHATLAKLFGASDYAGMLGGRWKTTKQYHHYIGTLQLNVIRPHLPVANLIDPRTHKA